MKRRHLLYTIGLFIGLLHSFGTTVQSMDKPRQQASTKTIIVGSELDYPPYCIVKQDGQPDGFSVDLFKAVASAINIKITFKVAPWNQLKQELAEGKIDALPLVGKTPEREDLYDFTLPYLTMHGTIVVRSDEKKINTLDDLNGKEIGVMMGDNAEEYLHRINMDKNLVLLPTFEEALTNLSAGMYDAVVMQKLVAIELIKKINAPNLVTVTNTLPGFEQNFCFAVTKGNSELINLLNEGFSIIIANGTFHNIRQKWFTPVAAMDFGKSRIVIGGNINNPPYEFLDNNGQPAGFLVDITRAIAEELNMLFDIQLRSRVENRVELENENIDALQGMFYSPERDSLFEFSSPHSLVSQVFVSRRGESSPTDLRDLSGKTVVVQIGSGMADLLEKSGNQNKIITADSPLDVIKKVIDQQCDYAILSRTQAHYFIKENKWKNLVVSETPIVLAQYCFVVSKNNVALLNILNEGLTTLSATGRYRDIYSKWLGPYEEPVFNFRNFLRYAIYILVPLVILLVFSLAWSRILTKQVTVKTGELENKNEELVRLTENLKETNVELIKAKSKAEENDRHKSNFLANMSHEIRTPMNGIIGFAELLEDPLLDDDDQKRYVKIIQENGERMLQLINDLIDISKIESGKIQISIQDFNLYHLLENIYNFFLPETRKKNLELTLSKGVSDSESMIRTDKNKLSQILTNIVKNSIKYTHQGEIIFGYAKKEKGFEFYVYDTGIGILPENQSKIFERFSREDFEKIHEYEGAGLGLSISKGFVEALGGKIWVQSEQGKGSTFNFFLPQ